MSSPRNSSTDRLLYSYRKALDLTLDAGAIPRRLWRILYPLYRIEVEGWQRPATDFEPVEVFIERGIEQSGLRSVRELSEFFHLEPRFVEKLVTHLQAIGHIELASDRLILTDLARDSLRDGCRYERLRTRQVLYFDGFRCRPLTRAHYRLKIYESWLTQEPQHFTALFPFHDWDPEALPKLLQRTDRPDYNVPDEIEDLWAISSGELAYLPIYIVERYDGSPVRLPRFLVFSAVKGYRDAVLEASVNSEPALAVAFSEDRQRDLRVDVAAHMDWRGLPESEWTFTPYGPLGPQVTVSAHGLLRAEKSLPEEDQSRPLTLIDVGQYIYVGDYCVWVTCKDDKVRAQAVVERALEWLQYAYAKPSADEVRWRLAQMSQRLDVSPPSLEELLSVAQSRRLGRAIERLDMMVVDSAEGE